MIKFVLCTDCKFLLGNSDSEYRNSHFIPWKYPKDMKRFKELTLHNQVVMGRKTYDSLGKTPLPNRKNIILSKTLNENTKGVYIARSIREVELLSQRRDVYIIGGSEIFSKFYSQTSVIYLTIIQHEYSGDIFFKEGEKLLNDFKVTSRVSNNPDRHHEFPFDFLTLERIY